MQSAPSRAAPPPARVPQSRWSQLSAPALEHYRPSAALAVAIAGPDPDGVAERTLAALAAQRYPRERLALVVAEELASERLDAAAERHSLRLERAAPGQLVRAAAGAGELVLFLSAGALPEPDWAAAHARWHETVCDAVSVGRSQRCDARLADPERLAAGELPSAAADDREGAAYDAFLEATRSLTERRADLFRIATADNLGVRSQLLSELSEPRAGGDPELARLDFAYRLELAGALFVAEPTARSLRHYPQARYQDPEAAADPRADSLIPVGGFRADGGGRLRARPALEVTLAAAADDGADDLLATVDALLAGRLSDLRLSLELPAAHPAREALEPALAADPRIALAEPGTGEPAEAPYTVRWPAPAVPDERTLADLRELIEAEEVGALHVTVPGEVPRNAMIEVMATGPLARARRLSAHLRDTGEPSPAEHPTVEMPPIPRGDNGAAPADPADPLVVLGELYGERWVSGVEVSVRRRGAPEPQVTEHGPLAPATDLDHERTQHLRHQGRADTLQARADRFAERAVRDRIRAREERLRAERLDARLAELGEPPWFWRMRIARRLGRGIRRS